MRQTDRTIFKSPLVPTKPFEQMRAPPAATATPPPRPLLRPLPAPPPASLDPPRVLGLLHRDHEDGSVDLFGDEGW